ncbi:MAG: DNA gyrase/topoisomerase IV subunit A, partial [Calditrichaeota bacterium]
NEKWLFASLEKIFIEKRIYRDIEECETWEAVLEAIDKGLEPYKALFFREITTEDIVRLTEIKIKRISKFDSFKADEIIRGLEADIKTTRYNLKHLTDYAIRYFEGLIKKYGAAHPRKTEIRTFETIAVKRVAVANRKLYVNRAEGFVGYGMKKDELVGECSDIDDIIAFKEDGTFVVNRVAEKLYVGKPVIHAAVWKKGDDRMVYNMIYRDGKDGRTYAKRFSVTSITRDRQYDLTKGTPGSKVLYFTANPNSESEIVTVQLNPRCKARNKKFDFDFSELAIKGRGSQGNVLTKWPVKKITQKEAGESTIGGLDIWYDPAIGRINTDERGNYLGTFEGDDRIVVFYKNGTVELTSYDLANHYDYEKIDRVLKYDPEQIFSMVHYDPQSDQFYAKRFKIDNPATGRLTPLISEARGSFVACFFEESEPRVDVKYLFGRKKERRMQTLLLTDIVDVKGWKARGNRLMAQPVVDVKPHPADGPEIILADERQPDLFDG